VCVLVILSNAIWRWTLVLRGKIVVPNPQAPLSHR
jgi:hypothetical protein